MNSRTKRILLFLFICVVVRTSFIGVAKYIQPEQLPLFAPFTLLIALGFIFAYVRNKPLGAFGGTVWWNNLRIFHAITYLIFSILALRQNKMSYFVLLFDIFIGVIFFMKHYITTN